MYGGETQAKGGCFDRQKLLQEHPLFSGLPAEIIERLSSYAVIKEVKRGTTIFTKGEAGNSLFAVCEGSVKMTSPSADGKDAVFNLINEGAIFGEIALLDGVGHLIGLLDRVGRDGGECLLHVPGAAADRVAQAGHDR